MGQWSCLSFVFYVSWVVGKLPKTVCKGWIDKVTPALQVVIGKPFTGEHKRDGNRMNSSDSWRCGILAFALASVATLSGVSGLVAVSYAVTYTAVAITCDTVPISDRPTDGWARSRRIFQE